MDITKIALERRQFTLLLLAILFFAGIQAYQNIPRAQDPGFIIRAAQVITYFPGASPERVEELVSEKLVEKIRQMPELDYVSSENKTGVSIIIVNIRETFTNMRPIWDSLRRKVEEAKRNLPEDASTPIVNDEFGDVFGSVYGITGDGYSYAEIKEIADSVRDQLLLLDDVAKVDILGAQEERIYVEYTPSRLNEIGISPKQLANALSSRNIINPGGEIYTRYETISLEPSGNFESINDLRSTLIAIPGSTELISLKDIAHVYRGYVDPSKNMMRLSGERAIGLAIAMRHGGNVVDLGRLVEGKMKALGASYPIGIDFHKVTMESDVVNKTVSDFIGNLVQAVVIVTLVMLVFLGLRTGIIVAMLIPVTIASAFFMMSIFDIGLDQISLAALMISLGLLVDNAIVMAESIMVKISNGEDRKIAALNAANELKIPLLTSSLTTSAAFLPIYLAESAIGEYTAPLFKVVTITLLCSLIIALTLIPLLCMLFVKIKQESTDKKNKSFFGVLTRLYMSFLNAVLRQRVLSIVVVLLVFVIAIKALAWVPKIFFPPKTDPIFTVELEFPLGTPLTYTEERVKTIENYLANNMIPTSKEEDGIKNWASFIGNGGVRFVLTHSPKPSSSNYAFLLVNTTKGGDTVDDIIARLDDYLFDEVSDGQYTIKKLENGTAIKHPVGVRLTGDNAEQLFIIADEIKQKIATLHGTINIQDDWGLSQKKVRIDIDPQRAQRAGVTHSDVATALQTAFSGITLTEFRENDTIIPVVMRSQHAGERNYDAAGTIGVLNNQGVSVPISQLVDPKLVFQTAKIFTRNGAKTVAISADLLPGVTATEINAELVPWLKERMNAWPPGYHWELGGEAESSGKANESIADKLPLAAFVICLLLMAQFNCIRRTVIILMTIPLALIGVSFGLLGANSYFGFMTMLGVISLAGIVINNAIVLLDKINQEHDESHHDWQQSVLNACQSRLRPILLTTFTTVLGLIPLWLGGGPMWEPMAITIIFGLLVSTVLTLMVIPLLFSLIFNVRYDR
ncbi:acriflavine resistance protein B [Gammaproteobacteria bacterium 45_16_T64]|nr:acriflavine resistance protein B [Gammaproteobacteria bacterium 45_16_T64]